MNSLTIKDKDFSPPPPISPTRGESKFLPRTFRQGLEILGFGVIYYVLGQLGILTAIPPGLASSVWPASGFALGIVLLRGYYLWPAIFGASLVVNFPTLLQHSHSSLFISLGVGVGVALGSALEILAASFLIRRMMKSNRPFDSARSAFLFVLISGASCFIAASFATLGLGLSQFVTWQDLGKIWITWWLGDFAGILVIAPLLLISVKNIFSRWKISQIIEFYFLGFLLLVSTQIVFQVPFTWNEFAYPFVYGFIPLVVWVAFRFGQRSTIFYVLLASILSIWGTVKGQGPFIKNASSLNDALLMLQTFIAVLAGLGLLTSAVVAERRRMAEDLRHHAEELSHSNKELEHFAFIASHDLKSPLRTISNYLDLFEREYGQQINPEGRQYISYAMADARRMGSLIDSLLEYSRVGQQKLVLEETSLAEVVKRAIADLRSEIEEAGAKVEIELLPEVLGNRTHLEQVFLNLLGNAIKFSKPGAPKIRIQARKMGNHWKISITDNGIGIPVEARDRIFNAFQRLHTQEEFPGSGIGLATCKKIIERHGGRIWVDSKVGEYSTFHFTLPGAWPSG